MDGDERSPAITPEIRANQLSMLGMLCAFASAVSLLYSGDYIFFKLGKFLDVYKSVKVLISPISELVFDYGIAAWGLLLIATVIAFDRAIRRPLDRHTLSLNVVVTIATVAFYFLVTHAVWAPLYNLLQGIGTSK